MSTLLCIIENLVGLRVDKEVQRQMKKRGFQSFEPLTRVIQQQASLHHRNTHQTSVAWKALPLCLPHCICSAPETCREVCLLGKWKHRADIIAKAYDKLIDEADTALLLTVVRESWGQELGNLNRLKPETPQRWLQRRLEHLPGLRGIAHVDVSLNIELDGTQHWQGHIHAVLTGGTPEEIKAALKIRPTSAVPKPVMLKPIREGDLARTLAYVTKPLPEGRVAYVAATGRQRQRYVNVPSGHLREHDEWRMSMLMPARLVIIGMRLGRNGTSECR